MDGIDTDAVAGVVVLVAFVLLLVWAWGRARKASQQVASLLARLDAAAEAEARAEAHQAVNVVVGHGASGGVDGRAARYEHRSGRGNHDYHELHDDELDQFHELYHDDELYHRAGLGEWDGGRGRSGAPGVDGPGAVLRRRPDRRSADHSVTEQRHARDAEPWP